MKSQTQETLIDGEVSNPFVTLGDLINEDIPIAALATAIEIGGIYSWDRFGRYGKTGDVNMAFVLDLLAKQYRWVMDPCVERLRDPRSPLEQYEEPPNNPDDAEDWVNPFDQFGWMKNERPDFDNIHQPQIENGLKPVNKAKRKAPDAFVAALVRLLVEIAKRDPDINIDEMPGIKTNLLAVASKFNAKLDCTETTFDSYIEGLCKFKRGSRTSKYYEELFPGYFK